MPSNADFARALFGVRVALTGAEVVNDTAATWSDGRCRESMKVLSAALASRKACAGITAPRSRTRAVSTIAGHTDGGMLLTPGIEYAANPLADVAYKIDS